MVNPGIISLELEALSVNEEVEAAIIPIVRTEGSDGTVSVSKVLTILLASYFASIRSRV